MISYRSLLLSTTVLKDIGVGVVDSHEVVGYSEAQQFSRWNGLELGLIALKMSQNTAKSMAYITNESGGDLQQGGQGVKVAKCSTVLVTYKACMPF